MACGLKNPDIRKRLDIVVGCFDTPGKHVYPGLRECETARDYGDRGRVSEAAVALFQRRRDSPQRLSCGLVMGRPRGSESAKVKAGYRSRLPIKSDKAAYVIRLPTSS